MEGGESIMKRIAGRDHPQVLVDAQSQPVNIDKRSLTTIIDAQSGQLDHPVRSNLVATSDKQSSNDTSLLDKVSSLINPSSATSNLPPTLTSVNGYRLGDVTHCLNIGGYPVVTDGILFEKQQNSIVRKSLNVQYMHVEVLHLDISKSLEMFPIYVKQIFSPKWAKLLL